MPEFHRSGVRLSYLDEGRGPAVVLLHAFPLHGELFRPQIDAFSRSNRWLIPDLRGFGKSASGERVTEMETFAQDVLAVMDEAGIERAVIGGVSMGGYAALALLAAAPARVRGLILIDSQMSADDELTKLRRDMMAKSVLERGADALVEELMQKLIATRDPAIRSRVETMIRASSPQGAAAALLGMALRPDRRDVLSRFRGPSLVLVGEHDPITPLEKAQQMTDALGTAPPNVILRAGHLASLEEPGEVNRLLGDFLSRVG